MVYKENSPLKIFHSEGLDTLPQKLKFIAQIEIAADIYVVKKGLLPIILEWRLRVYDNDTIVYSCMANHNLLLKFEKGESAINDIIKMIEDSHSMFSEKFKKEVAESGIENNDLTKVSDETKFNKAYQILEIAKIQGLV